MKYLLTLFFLSIAAWGQCGKTVYNPHTGKLDCIGAAGAFTDDGTTLSTSRNLSVGATVLGVAAITSSYVVASNITFVAVNATSGPITVTLPAVAVAGREVVVIKTDASSNSVTVSAAAGETIIGSLTFTPFTQQWSTYSFFSTGSAWGIR